MRDVQGRPRGSNTRSDRYQGWGMLRGGAGINTAELEGQCSSIHAAGADAPPCAPPTACGDPPEAGGLGFRGWLGATCVSSASARGRGCEHAWSCSLGHHRRAQAWGRAGEAWSPRHQTSSLVNIAVAPKQLGLSACGPPAHPPTDVPQARARTRAPALAGRATPERLRRATPRRTYTPPGFGCPRCHHRLIAEPRTARALRRPDHTHPRYPPAAGP